MERRRNEQASGARPNFAFSRRKGPRRDLGEERPRATETIARSRVHTIDTDPRVLERVVKRSVKDWSDGSDDRPRTSTRRYHATR